MENYAFLLEEIKKLQYRLEELENQQKDKTTPAYWSCKML